MDLLFTIYENRQFRGLQKISLKVTMNLNNFKRNRKLPARGKYSVTTVDQNVRPELEPKLERTKSKYFLIGNKLSNRKWLRPKFPKIKCSLN
jgi:hypothetical protein